LEVGYLKPLIGCIEKELWEWKIHTPRLSKVKEMKPKLSPSNFKNYAAHSHVVAGKACQALALYSSNL